VTFDRAFFRPTNTQINVLQFLATRGGWATFVEINRRFNATIRHVGPRCPEDVGRYEEEYGHPSLMGMGYVTTRMEERDEAVGGQSCVVSLSAEGEDAARRFRTRKGDKRHRVPRDQLDAAGRAIRPTRTYAFEAYTTEDLDQIRDLLDEEYQDVSDDYLKHQLANRRKAGAFGGDDINSKWPDWYRHYRSLRSWLDTAEEAISQAGGRCAVNWAHDGDGKEGPLDVYHRHLVHHGVCVLGSEGPRDIVVLCRACRKRLKTSLPVPPEDRPSW
jgi:hypothetical protein